MNWPLAKSLLFRLDPETAHNLALLAIRRGWVKTGPPVPGLERELFGVRFPNPVGLAAGFDKNGIAIDRWKDLGFGFAEIGTVTRHPQPGNPKPRLFRLVPDRAVINRMGFNNEGSDALARRLENADPGIPLGINIGKSKVTDLADAAEDYAYSYRLLKDRADYVVVNVSSPNTPGLRSLQDREPLTRVLWRLREIDSKKPMFVKVAPDLEEEGLEELVEVCLDLGLTGIVATNTTVSRTGLSHDPSQDGGLSGAPLTNLADTTLATLLKLSEGRLHLIGVGGVMSPADAARKLELGASLVQVYTGWIYNGPLFVDEICKNLARSASSAQALTGSP